MRQSPQTALNKLIAREYALADDYRRRAASLMRQADEIEAKLMSNAKKWKGTKWVNVNKVDLVVDEVYILRRVYVRMKQFEEPVVARWTKNGWQDIIGKLHTATRSDATVEIWR